jgi:co-chaperonin GroES (HSP10)
MKPLGYYILVEIPEIEEKSEGGIIMPKSLTEKEQMVDQEGVILEIGPTAFAGYPGCDVEGKTPAECWGVQVGDKVHFEKYAGDLDDGDSIRLMPDSKIIGLIERGES